MTVQCRAYTAVIADLLPATAWQRAEQIVQQVSAPASRLARHLANQERTLPHLHVYAHAILHAASC